jgi:phosphoglycolate phosphatase
MLIIFDLDGTLFQTAVCDVNAVHKLCDELGIKHVAEREIIAGIGKTIYNFLNDILPSNNLLDEVCIRFRELERTEVIERGELFPGIPQMLEKLRGEGHTLAICSNGSLEYIMLVLDHMGITGFFHEIQSAKYIGSKTEVVRQMLRESKNAVMVGDTKSDFCAANANNIPSVGVTYGYGISTDLEQATFTSNNAMQICEVISQIDVFFQITDKLIRCGKRSIGINGVDTSGKTILANNLSHFLKQIGIKNTIIHIDDFHNPIAIRYQGENEIDSYYKNAFNYTQLIEEILLPLRQNGTVDKVLLCLNLDTDKYDKAIHFTIDSDTVILIEGVLLFRPPLLEFLDGRVFVHINFEEVLRRANLRDVPKYGEVFLKKYINKYIPIQKIYFKEHNPLHNSDIVIDNNDYLNPRFRVNN